MSDLLEFTFECKVVAGEAFMDEALRANGVLKKLEAYAAPMDIKLTMTELPNPARDLPMIRDQLEETGKRVVAIFVPGVEEGAWSDCMVRWIHHKGESYPLNVVLENLGFPDL